MIELTMFGATIFFSFILVNVHDFYKKKLDAIDSVDVNNAYLFSFSYRLSNVCTFFFNILYKKWKEKHAIFRLPNVYTF